ncbi:Nif3-like dinuclear metal center hexameric protein [Desulfurobacterium atlanticum]|uniref:GTP cyclohydrolase 1 type 2 homolog n=1 Tax=Desulfurobacterium atlanticum TaxID=240169 RepID=A0A238YG26_9BACT|nr:Nif3-like dinuclear metal center hexameric protein [Desulfurobacterium atlanticum]SNR69574.1 dinuclear metal center protein, YbgI/SA1388 family [Desulfurobacterium atlanticum]
MAKYFEIVKFLKTVVPENIQDSWDNSGVQIGIDVEVSRVLFALSLSSAILKEAKEKKVDMIISHHPITISGFKNLSESRYPDKLIIEFIKEGIAVYSLHTNLDVSPLGPSAVIGEIVGLKQVSSLLDEEGVVPYGVVGKIEPITQKALFDMLVSYLPADVFRVVNFSADKMVEKVSICSGSGGSLIAQAAKKSDVYITGDVKYHDAELAVELGLTVFDMGHFGTEKLFSVKLEKVLKERFPEITFLRAETEKSPFEVVL